MPYSPYLHFLLSLSVSFFLPLSFIAPSHPFFLSFFLSFIVLLVLFPVPYPPLKSQTLKVSLRLYGKPFVCQLFDNFLPIFLQYFQQLVQIFILPPPLPLILQMILPKEKMDAACGTLSYVAPEVSTT